MPQKSKLSRSALEEQRVKHEERRQQHLQFRAKTQESLRKFDNLIESLKKREIDDGRINDAAMKKLHHKEMREIEEALRFQCDDDLSRFVKFGIIETAKDKLNPTVYGFTFTLSKNGDTEVFKMPPPPPETGIMAPDPTLTDARHMVLGGAVRKLLMTFSKRFCRETIAKSRARDQQEKLEAKDQQVKLEAEIKSVFEQARALGDSAFAMEMVLNEAKSI